MKTHQQHQHIKQSRKKPNSINLKKGAHTETRNWSRTRRRNRKGNGERPTGSDEMRFLGGSRGGVLLVLGRVGVRRRRLLLSGGLLGGKGLLRSAVLPGPPSLPLSRGRALQRRGRRGSRRRHRGRRHRGRVRVDHVEPATFCRWHEPIGRWDSGVGRSGDGVLVVEVVEVGAELALTGFHLRGERERECVWNEIFLIFFSFNFSSKGIDFCVLNKRKEEELCVLNRSIGYFLIFFFMIWLDFSFPN